MNVKGKGISGWKPWSAPDAEVETTRNIVGYKLPSQEEINNCLNCTLPDCTDCVGRTGKRKYYTPTQRKRYPEGYLETNILALHRQGKKVKEIASIIGVAKQTVYLYLSKERKKGNTNESDKQHNPET